MRDLFCSQPSVHFRCNAQSPRFPERIGFAAAPMASCTLPRYFLSLAHPTHGLGLTAESTSSRLLARNIRLLFVLDVAYDRFAYMTHKVSQ
jgi:hypothetical protein